ncbi:uncharacterized protein PAC_09433 [Phialocephala subalpina]|uniref:Uncharacterized protein n=1 Tax=Phialocephala subalpina TaxID=576137 RepID=A0A1L7X3D9_9HELO|nr:uncharacterized protein PAC_09433 [Phialocephala subalpina]
MLPDILAAPQEPPSQTSNPTTPPAAAPKPTWTLAEKLRAQAEEKAKKAAKKKEEEKNPAATKAAAAAAEPEPEPLPTYTYTVRTQDLLRQAEIVSKNAKVKIPDTIVQVEERAIKARRLGSSTATSEASKSNSKPKYKPKSRPDTHDFSGLSNRFSNLDVQEPEDIVDTSATIQALDIASIFNHENNPIRQFHLPVNRKVLMKFEKFAKTRAEFPQPIPSARMLYMFDQDRLKSPEDQKMMAEDTFLCQDTMEPIFFNMITSTSAQVKMGATKADLEFPVENLTRDEFTRGSYRLTKKREISAWTQSTQKRTRIRVCPDGVMDVQGGRWRTNWGVDEAKKIFEDSQWIEKNVYEHMKNNWFSEYLKNKSPRKFYHTLEELEAAHPDYIIEKHMGTIFTGALSVGEKECSSRFEIQLGFSCKKFSGDSRLQNPRSLLGNARAGMENGPQMKDTQISTILRQSLNKEKTLQQSLLQLETRIQEEKSAGKPKSKAMVRYRPQLTPLQLLSQLHISTVRKCNVILETIREEVVTRMAARGYEGVKYPRSKHREIDSNEPGHVVMVMQILEESAVNLDLQEEELRKMMKAVLDEILPDIIKDEDGKKRGEKAMKEYGVKHAKAVEKKLEAKKEAPKEAGADQDGLSMAERLKLANKVKAAFASF